MKFLKQIQNLVMTAIFVLLFNVVNAQVTKVPFEFKGAHMYIKVKTAKSDTLNFIFDTGCTGAAIDIAASEKAAINKDVLTPVNVAGNGGAQNYNMAMGQNLQLGNVNIQGINLVLTDFSSLSASIGHRMDGIVGYEIMDRYVTQIDFDKKQLLLYNGIKSVDTSGYVGIPFEFSKNILIPRFPISVTLDNGETFTGKVMFDTGNAFSLIVSTPFSKFHNFNDKLGETKLTWGQGSSAVTRDKQAIIKSMSFNGFNFGKMLIRLTENDKAEPRDGYLGILGIEVIKHFNVILDYANKKIYLKPNSGYKATFPVEFAAQSPQEIALEKNQKEAKAFLNANKIKPDVKVTASGLQYKIIKNGTGAIPAKSDKVSIHYVFSMPDGTIVQDDWKSSEWIHGIDKALPGMQEAITMMPVGSKWVLYMPAELAFGDYGYQFENNGGRNISPGAVLVCEIELVNIIKRQ